MQKPADNVQSGGRDTSLHVGGRAAVHVGAARRHVAARAVGSYVPKLTRKAFEKYGFSAATLVTDWAQIVGADIAAKCRPERLRWQKIKDDSTGYDKSRPAATLILTTDPASALDIQYSVQQILERINSYFGYRAVAEIRIVQSVASKAPQTPISRAVARESSPLPELASIPDDGLRAALCRLHAGVTAHSR